MEIFSKKKFNWNRFYDELESADPHKFPYHIWIVHEITSFLIHSVVVSVSVLFFGYIGIVVWLAIAEEYPDLTYKYLSTAICGYIEYNDTK